MNQSFISVLVAIACCPSAMSIDHHVIQTILPTEFVSYVKARGQNCDTKFSLRDKLDKQNYYLLALTVNLNTKVTDVVSIELDGVQKIPVETAVETDNKKEVKINPIYKKPSEDFSPTQVQDAFNKAIQNFDAFKLVGIEKFNSFASSLALFDINLGSISMGTFLGVVFTGYVCENALLPVKKTLEFSESELRQFLKWTSDNGPTALVVSGRIAKNSPFSY